MEEQKTKFKPLFDPLISRLVIDPNNISEKLLDEMEIDLGMRGLVSKLLKKGYDTQFSCAGHGFKTPYLAFKKGTGDGSFEKEAGRYGFKLKEENPCCKESQDNFCGKCGGSKIYDGYQGDSKKPLDWLGHLIS
ncbi:MAG: hypothetical protein KJ939_00270 [Nanoarchaeota archaeon]|nr:hypothetical protein [Nanoarchaeota archaeon]MBU4351503.1 hypothetical protein [Nanoarchaeota archaeon]